MWGGRVAWLGRPWFFVAVVVLALNDHVFKGAWPGWVTGKLSDVAGVLVVATLAAVLTGPTWGMVLAGLGFVALKTIPGVAEAVSPLLGGGVVLRDPSDLIALAVLPPLWWLVRHERPARAARTRRAWQAIGLVAAVLVTTATSPRPEDGVHQVVYSGDAFLVRLSTQHRASLVYASRDGGRTWTAEAGSYPSVFYGQTDGSRSCAADGVCYRIEQDGSGCRITRVDGIAWQGSDPLPGGCPARSFIAVDPDDSSRAVSLAGSEGLAYRDAAGRWTYVGILEQVRGPTSAQDFRTTLGGPYVTLGLVLVLSLLIGFGFGNVTGRVITITSLWLAVPSLLLFGSYGHWQDNSGWNLVLACGVVLVALVLVERTWMERTRPPAPRRSGSGFDPPSGAR